MQRKCHPGSPGAMIGLIAGCVLVAGLAGCASRAAREKLEKRLNAARDEILTLKARVAEQEKEIRSYRRMIALVST